ncbi:hypothetical protein ACIXIV_20980, partial [Bacteroides fragilis]
DNPLKMFSYLISIAKIIVLLCVIQKIYLNLPPISSPVTYEVTGRPNGSETNILSESTIK